MDKENILTDKMEDNKKMLYDLNLHLQDVLIDTIISYSGLGKLNLNSTALDDTEIIQHQKLLIAINKKIELINKYLNDIQETISDYDKFDLIAFKLESEVAESINNFLIENLPAEDMNIIDDDYTPLQWIKAKDTTKKFIKASER